VEGGVEVGLQNCLEGVHYCNGVRENGGVEMAAEVDLEEEKAEVVDSIRCKKAASLQMAFEVWYDNNSP